MDETSQRNVVLVTIDSLRADHCGFNGGRDDTTPTLDTLSDEGIVFENAVAPGPRTPSSMPTVFTGNTLTEPPAEMMDWRARHQRINRHLSRHRTIPERFKSKGYATAGLTTNPWTTRDTGFDTGFDTFVQSEDIDGEWPLTLRALDRLIDLTGTADRFTWENKRDWFTQWPNLYQQLLDLVHTLSEPYFLWIFLLDTHQPYLAPAPYRQETNAAEMYLAAAEYWNYLYRKGAETLPDSSAARVTRSYRDTVRSVDGFMKQLWRDIGDDDPVIAFHADHGEAFGEHGTFGHQQTLFEENLHVPLLFMNTGSSARLSDVVSLRKLPEMLLTVAEGATPDVTNRVVAAETETQDKLILRSQQWKYYTGDSTQQLYAIEKGKEVADNGSYSNTSGLADLFEQLAAHYQHDRDEKRAVLDAIESLDDNRL